MNKKKLFSCLCLLAMLAINSTRSTAQVTVFGAGYFQNQYLFNPAMSGREAGKGTLGAGYRKSGDVKDGPQSFYLTGDYAFDARMGAGVNISYDKAGLFNSTKAMATYSYHVQVGDETKLLHFGISAGGTHRRLNDKAIVGDRDDPSIYNFNDQFMRFEADFGMAYTDGKLTLQAAAPNLVATFKNDPKDVVNRNRYMASASYKFRPGGEDQDWTVEPKVVYRGINGTKSIVDAGANIGYKEYINLFGLYHSSKNVTAGLGVKLSGVAQLTALYSTQASAFRAYSGGDYEIGLLFNF